MTDKERLNSELSRMRVLFGQPHFRKAQEAHLRSQADQAQALRQAIQERDQAMQELEALRAALAKLL